jgi:hypothetical protein
MKGRRHTRVAHREAFPPDSDALTLDEAEDALRPCEDLADKAQQRHPHNGRDIQPVEWLDHLARRLQERLCTQGSTVVQQRVGGVATEKVPGWLAWEVTLVVEFIAIMSKCSQSSRPGPAGVQRHFSQGQRWLAAPPTPPMLAHLWVCTRWTTASPCR